MKVVTPLEIAHAQSPSPPLHLFLNEPLLCSTYTTEQHLNSLLGKIDKRLSREYQVRVSIDHIKEVVLH